MKSMSSASRQELLSSLSNGELGGRIINVGQRKQTAVNGRRATQGLRAIEIECLLVLNDANRDAIELLKTHVAPMQVEIAQALPKLHLRVEYLNNPFEEAYPKIKLLLEQGRYRNVLFNLDQCGDAHVKRSTIQDIMHSYTNSL